MVEYVVGFAFGRVPGLFSTHVLLIKKNRPANQAGLLNGVGGKMKPREHYKVAMAREFEEETGLATSPDHWHLVTTVHVGNRGRVYYFRADVDIASAKQTTDERLLTLPVMDVGRNGIRVMPDLKWLLPMALNHREDDSTEHYDIKVK